MASEPRSNRYVCLRCPVCAWTSSICDQQIDPTRQPLAVDWQRHLHDSHPYPAPIIERAEREVTDGE
jgi:hypothetical protein